MSLSNYSCVKKENITNPTFPFAFFRSEQTDVKKDRPENKTFVVCT
jgi:hypothetical protein